jgi:cell wall-associated NlpC family hydrolase
MPRAFAAFGAFLVATAAGLGLVTLTALGAPALSRMPPCLTSGPLPGLSAAQAENARVVVGTSSARGGHQAALISLMTALAESDLRVLANPNDPSGAGLANQGVGHDHDSLGLFQQRASWGTAAQRMSSVESTNLFVDALLAVPDWTTMPPWYAAQLVQRSAYDGRPSPANGGSRVAGENYLRQADRANAILSEIEGSAMAVDCGATDGDLPAGNTGQHGLPADFSLPLTTSEPARTAVTFALAQLGKPYLWGGTGPDAFDCSGLTQEAWRRGGIAIGRTTYAQLNEGSPATRATLRPGDLVLVPGSDGTLAAPGHMGMYIGHGLVVHAPKTGDVIRVVTYDSFTAGGVSGLRHIA